MGIVLYGNGFNGQIGFEWTNVLNAVSDEMFHR